jgi:hypothetical protein
MLEAIRAQQDAKSAMVKNSEVVTTLKAMRLTRAAELVASHGRGV